MVRLVTLIYYDIFVYKLNSLKNKHDKPLANSCSLKSTHIQIKLVLALDANVSLSTASRFHLEKQ